MENIKVSVILPVFNTEKYLEECLDSVVNQTLRETEIICVDDGSTDGSPEILRKYAEKDARIVVCRQENCGQSAARNKGVTKASGKYLYFMDSDDILELSALKILYEKAEADHTDVIYFDGDSFTTNPEYEKLSAFYTKYYSRTSNYGGIQEGRTLLSKMFRCDEYRVVVWLQFIDRNYYMRNKLDFYEGIIHEDELFNYECMVLAGRAEHLPLQLFHRRIRSDSTMTKKASFANVYGYFICYLELDRFYKEHKLADLGDETLFTPIKKTLSSSRSYYMDLTPEERKKARDLPDDLRESFQTLVADVCNKRLKKEAARKKFLAPFAKMAALKNSVFSGFNGR